MSTNNMAIGGGAASGGTLTMSADGSTIWYGTPIYGGTNINWGVSTQAGTEAKMQFKENAKKEISASLYLKFVKSKLTKVQVEKVKRRLAKLQKLVAYSQDMGQQALYEELTKEVAILVREAEMSAFGIDTWVTADNINKFRNIVKEKVIKWEPLEKFPRVVPANVQKKVKALQKAGIFDEFWILFIDYTDQKLNTNKEKIRQKDPILFGKLKYHPNNFYYIADWVDEYCDLTLDKMVDKIKLEDPEFALGEMPDLDQDRWDGIVKEVRERVERLENTKASNYRQHMAEEDEAKKKREAEEVKAKKKWWKFW